MSIDWTKRLFDQEGNEYFPVLNSAGEQMRTASEQQRWVRTENYCFRADEDGKLRGGYSGTLTNNGRPSWERELVDDFLVKLRYGKRDGVWFAEVVQP